MNPSVSKANVSEELLISQITDEFMERLDRGERPDVEQYARQHPELASVLRQVLPALQMVRDSSANNDQAQTLEADVPQEPLGDFHIIREIGRGGMGVVYEADQLSLGRKVALKVLPFAATMDPRQLQRFKNEAMAAASLDHPNMVDVYGVGCERGVHYYAMRLIDGHTLAEVISQLQQLHHTGGAIPDSVSGVFSSAPGEPEQEVRSSTPNELTEDYKGPTGDIPAEKKETQAEIQAGVATKKSRFNPAYFRSIADLGLQVAEALDHAHHEGIIHRDIKPSNLMLDSRGKIWITDFGLAHVETGGSLTLTGDLVGTVRYMSPEQAFAKRVPLDHRTDVYSLGVTLYELLTLQPAFGGNDRQELLRQIAFEEPSPPRKLNSSVPADLETIVLKAMEKNPGDRYATAEELADDLRRYLDDQPIKARRASVPQRIGKWVRRHQALVGSAAAVLLISCLILGTSIGWLVRGEEIRREVAAGKASQARDRVHQLAEAGRWNEARAVALHADSILAGGGNAALRKMVQEQVGDLTLLVEIDKLSLKKTERYNEVGNWDLKAFAREYTKHFAQWGITPGKTPAQQVADRIKPRWSAAVREALLTAFYQWRWTMDKDHPHREWTLEVISLADADPWRKQVRQAGSGEVDLPAMRKLMRKVDVTKQPPDLLAHLGMVLINYDDYATAVELLRKVHAHHPENFWVNQNLGTALVLYSEPKEAARYLTAAVTLKPSAGLYMNLGIALDKSGEWKKAEAAYHTSLALAPDYASAWGNLGVLYANQKDYRKAEEVLRKAIELEKQFAMAHFNLGKSLDRLGKPDQAVSAYRRAIDLKEGKYADALVALGRLSLDKDKLDDAAAEFQKAIKANPHFLPAYQNLVSLFNKQGKQKEAGAVLKQARQAFEDRSALIKTTALDYAELGRVVSAGGQLDDAIAAYEEALRLQPGYVEVLNNLGLLLRKKGKLSEAVAAYRAAVFHEPKLFVPHGNLVIALIAQGRIKEGWNAWRNSIGQCFNNAVFDERVAPRLTAKEALDKVMAADEERFLRKSDYALAYDTLAMLYLENGRYDLAIETWTAVLALREKKAKVYYNLGICYAKNGDPDAALAAYETSITLDPKSVKTRVNYGKVLSEKGRVDDAIAEYKEAIKLKPDFAKAHNNLGAAYRRIKELGKAIASYRTAIKSKPDYAEAYSNLGAALAANNEPDAALAAYKKSIELKPHFAELHYNLGNFYIERDQLDAAIDCYKLAIHHDPQFARAYNNLGNSLQNTSEPERAGPYLKKAVELQPDLPKAHYNLGLWYQRKKMLDEAIACYREATFYKADYANAWDNLGVALRDKGELLEAIKCHRKAIDSEQSHATAHFNLGYSLVKIGKNKEAKTAYKNAIGIRQFYPEAHNNLGSLLRKEGDVDGAIKSFQTAISQKPNYLPAHFNLGLAFREKGKWAKARRAFDRCEQLAAKNRSWPYPTAAWSQGLARILEIEELHQKKSLPASAILDELTGKDPLDKVQKKSHAKIHKYELKADQAYSIELISPDFDAMVRVESADGEVLAAGDDVLMGADKDSRLFFAAPKTDTYQIVVTTYKDGKTGHYCLLIRPLQKVGAPQVVSSQLANTDPQSGGRPYKLRPIALRENRYLLIEMKSKEFDAYVAMGNANKRNLADDNDGGDGSNSRLLFAADRDSIYFIVSSTARPGSTGAFTMRIQEYLPAADAEVPKVLKSSKK